MRKYEIEKERGRQKDKDGERERRNIKTEGDNGREIER